MRENENAEFVADSSRAKPSNRDELPTVQDALCKVNPTQVAQEFCALFPTCAYGDREKASSKDTAVAIERIVQLLLTLADIKAEEPSAHEVFMTYREFEWSEVERKITQRAVAYIVENSYVVQAEKRCKEGGNPLLLDTASPLLMSWEEVLSCRIWFGRGFSEHEKTQALCCILWYMTFFGWTQEEVADSISEIQEELSELDKAVAEHPETYENDMASFSESRSEAREIRCYSAEDLIATFFDDENGSSVESDTKMERREKIEKEVERLNRQENEKLFQEAKKLFN